MMKHLSEAETKKAYSNMMAPSSVKVCMHVLGKVRTDVRVMREATALVEAGFSVSIIDVEGERSVPDEENIHDVCVKHIMSSSWFVSTRFKPWFLIKFLAMILWSIVRLVRVPADIYHAQDQRALPACFIAALLRRKSLVFDAHELPLSDSTLKRWQRLHALSTRFLVSVLPRCAGIITVSSPIAQEICTHYRVPAVSLVRNVPAYQAVPRSDILRHHLGVSQNVRIALYQGGMQPNRGLDRLVRAAPFLGPDILIVMLGETAGETQLQLKALIASEGVTDRVKLLPPVPYEELLEWTASADIGLIIYSPDDSLNVRMCLPNKLFEYLMAGLPVLASELDAVVDVIKTYDVGQVTYSLSPADVGVAITAMLADPIALADMRRHALEAARQEFCWEKEKLQLLLFYQNILAISSMYEK
jgi:glycosyltransferase involved in cell wall biosynthesis